MIADSIAVAVVQMAVEDGRPDANRAVAFERLEAAASEGARLLLLPELWTTGYDHARWPSVADEASPRVVDEMRRFSLDHDVVVGGTMIERLRSGGLVNRFRLCGPEGDLAVYDKVHLFAPMAEDRHLVAGGERAKAVVRGWRCGLSTCFDLRFPEMYRLDAVDGVEVFLVPAEWPAERAAVMRGLAWARAVENQAYLVLANRTGVARDGTRFGGGSLVVAPDGAVLAEAGPEEAVLRACLERDALGLRSRFPVLDRRVPGVDWPV